MKNMTTMNNTTVKELEMFGHIALEVVSDKARVWIGRGWKTVWEDVNKPSSMARAVIVEYDPCKDYGRVDTYPVENFERNPDLVEKIARLALDYVGRYQNTPPAERVKLKRGIRKLVFELQQASKAK